MVTRFDIFEDLLSIWQSFDPTLEVSFAIGQIINVVNSQILIKSTSPLATLLAITKTNNFTTVSSQQAYLVIVQNNYYL